MLANVEWAKRNFEGAHLGDVRRTRRAVGLASKMLSKPGVSIPQLNETAYDVKASYNLFSHPSSTPENLQAGHRELVHEALHASHAPGNANARGSETRLLVEDTTTMSWPSEHPIAGLAPIGEKNALSQGFLLHSVLAMSWAKGVASLENSGAEPAVAELPQLSSGQSSRHPPLSLLGVADQQFVLRKPVPEDEAQLPEGSRAFRRSERADRESRLWLESTSHLGTAPEGPTQVRWVRICDRGADIYEFLRSAIEAHHGFVVRAAQNRTLAEEGNEGEHLFERVRAEEPIATLTLQLRSRPGRAARSAELNVSACRVALRSPRRRGASPGKLAPIHCTAVRAWEETPPEGEDPLEWILLTDVEVVSDVVSSAVVECVLQYATRWVIEEFHQVLKTGLGAERLQLETAERLFAAIALMSVVAIRVLALREWVRSEPDAPANRAGIDNFALELLRRRLRRRLTTVREVALAIGRLGGHMNRKRDGMPGWKTLWLGLRELDSMVLGARLALQEERFG